MLKHSRPLIVRLLVFAATVLLVALILSVLSWLPSLMQTQRLKKFSSVEMAHKELRTSRIYMPTYIPEHLGLTWPPSEIYGQDRPFDALIMYVSYKEKQETGLVIHQISAEANYEIEPHMDFRKTGDGRRVEIKKRPALLFPALCNGESPCNAVSWKEEGTVITVIGKCTAQDVIKIAASMLP